MSDRAHILATLKNALPSGDARLETVRARIAAHRSGIIPARGQLPQKERVELFCRLARKVDVEVSHLDRLADLPALIARLDVPKKAKVAPHPVLQGLDWSGIDVAFGRAEDEDLLGIAVAYGGVAESGTLVMRSGAQSPTTLNFLPDTQIVALFAKDVAASYEEVWQRLRQEPDFMPRTVNWITGPSRSADIEQTLQLGVHGPRRLLVVVIDGA